MSDAANNLATGTAHGPDTVDGIRDLIYAALCNDFEPGTIDPGDAFTFITIDDSQTESKLALVNQINNSVWLVTVQPAKIQPTFPGVIYWTHQTKATT